MTIENSSPELQQSTPKRAVGLRFLIEEIQVTNTQPTLAWHRRMYKDITRNIVAFVIYANGDKSRIPFAANSALFNGCLEKCNQLVSRLASLQQELEQTSQVQGSPFYSTSEYEESPTLHYSRAFNR